MEEQELAAYSQALVTTLRLARPSDLREFAAIWGQRLHNRGLQQLAKAPDEVVEWRMWMMIRDRPDLGALQLEAEAWLAGHPTDQEPT